ncbi:hypothetical protein VQZ12_002815 [Salmonella enterica]|nr:hypothetical protein [Salmonella enterica subsp. salamae]EKC2494635.1 hypothetical protein [Salmonella enterica]EMD3916478.1 hypothetical protein [Salmonella enterica]
MILYMKSVESPDSERVLARPTADNDEAGAAMLRLASGNNFKAICTLDFAMGSDYLPFYGYSFPWKSRNKSACLSIHKD